MPSYCDIYDLLHSDGDLWKKAEVAALIAAIAVNYESAATANHEARLIWAQAVFNDPPQWVKDNKVKILENPTVLAAGHFATDNDVQYVVNGLVPAAA